MKIYENYKKIIVYRSLLLTPNSPSTDSTSSGEKIFSEIHYFFFQSEEILKLKEQNQPLISSQPFFQQKNYETQEKKTF